MPPKPPVKAPTPKPSVATTSTTQNKPSTVGTQAQKPKGGVTTAQNSAKPTASRPSVKLASSTSTATFGNKSTSSTSPPVKAKGVDPLIKTNHIFIRKTKESLDAFFHGPTPFKAFEILSTQELRIFFAVDITEFPPMSQICPCLAPKTFIVRILNSEGREVLVISGHLGLGSKAEVRSNDEYFGYVHLDGRGAGLTYTGLNKTGDCVFTIKPDEVGVKDFKISSPNGKLILGKVTQNWTATQTKYPEWFSRGDTFGLSFAKDQNIKTKALLLGAAILLFFQFFKGR